MLKLYTVQFPNDSVETDEAKTLIDSIFYESIHQPQYGLHFVVCVPKDEPDTGRLASGGLSFMISELVVYKLSKDMLSQINAMSKRVKAKIEQQEMAKITYRPLSAPILPENVVALDLFRKGKKAEINPTDAPYPPG